MQNDNSYLGGTPPKERTVVPPRGGWRPRTYYVVEVALHHTNIVHRSIFYSGFLNGPESGPGGYNALMNPTYDRMYDENPYRTLHYLKVIRVLGDRQLEEIKDDPAN